MPAQLSTVMYIADYKEKTTTDYFIGNATGYTRLEEGNAFQTFNITVFYPTDNIKPCYVPKLEVGQIFSIANSKFSVGSNNELDIILTSGTVLDIAADKMPVHPINIVGMAVASEPACITDLGVQIECIISDYLSKDKPTEISVTLFHPTGSRFTNQTSTIKHGSSMFFSGSLTLIEGKIYLELHNFSFIRGQSSSFASVSTKHMPWLDSLKSSNSASPISIAQAIHNKSQQTHNSSQKPLPVFNKSQQTPISLQNTSLDNSQQTSNSLQQTLPTISQSVSFLPSTPPSTPIKAKNIKNKNSQQTPPKRKTRSSLRANKLQKLSDIASNALAAADPKNDSEDTQ